MGMQGPFAFRPVVASLQPSSLLPPPRPAAATPRVGGYTLFAASAAIMIYSPDEDGVGAAIAACGFSARATLSRACDCGSGVAGLDEGPRSASLSSPAVAGCSVRQTIVLTPSQLYTSPAWPMCEWPIIVFVVRAGLSCEWPITVFVVRVGVDYMYEGPAW